MQYKCEACFKMVDDIVVINGTFICKKCAYACVNCGDAYSSDKKYYVEICDDCHEKSIKERT